MDALRELFGTWIGLLSLGALVFMIGMGVFINRWFVSQIKREEAQRLATRR